MSSSKNKSVLTSFLCRTWSEIAGAAVDSGKVLILAGGFEDGKEAKAVTKTEVVCLKNLYSTQEEADTRIILHIQDASMNSKAVVVWSPDTDVAILGMHYVRRLGIELWFKTGVKDKARFVPLHELARNVGEDICQLLPGIHSLTGCDSTSGFFSVGKVRPLKWAQHNLSAALPLQDLGNGTEVSQATTTAAFTMVCQLYDQKYQGCDINDLRYRLFCRKQSKNETLPPTADSLKLHIQRANYQCLIWKNALNAKPDLPSPIGHGWQELNGCMKPQLMTLEPAPHALMEVVTCNCKSRALQLLCRRTYLHCSLCM